MMISVSAGSTLPPTDAPFLVMLWLAKVIADNRYGEILGVHIIGPCSRDHHAGIAHHGDEDYGE